MQIYSFVGQLGFQVAITSRSWMIDARLVLDII